LNSVNKLLLSDIQSYRLRCSKPVEKYVNKYSSFYIYLFTEDWKFEIAAFLNYCAVSFIRYIERLRRMDCLISLMTTGTPSEFAGKLGIGRSVLFQYIQEMREMGVDIRYSNARKSYYYANERRIKIIVEDYDS